MGLRSYEAGFFLTFGFVSFRDPRAEASAWVIGEVVIRTGKANMAGQWKNVP
jgi:hypothetical protein